MNTLIFALIIINVLMGIGLLHLLTFQHDLKCMFHEYQDEQQIKLHKVEQWVQEQCDEQINRINRGAALFGKLLKLEGYEVVEPTNHLTLKKTKCTK